MDSSDEDAADDDPDDGGEPSEHDSGEDGADDWARGGDSGEVLAEEELGFGWGVVGSVVELLCGGFSVWIELEELGEEAAVDAVGGEEECGADEDDGEEGLFPFSLGRVLLGVGCWVVDSGSPSPTPPSFFTALKTREGPGRSDARQIYR